jgi:hypothetical protein
MAFELRFLDRDTRNPHVLRPRNASCNTNELLPDPDELPHLYADDTYDRHQVHRPSTLVNTAPNWPSGMREVQMGSAADWPVGCAEIDGVAIGDAINASDEDNEIADAILESRLQRAPAQRLELVDEMSDPEWYAKQYDSTFNQRDDDELAKLRNMRLYTETEKEGVTPVVFYA